MPDEPAVFTLGEFHEGRDFDLLDDTSGVFRVAPIDAADIHALRASRDGCAFESESLDGAEFYRLYFMGLVSIAEGRPGWPIAQITRTGNLILNAVIIALESPDDLEERPNNG